ncbi:MAG: transcription termination/antitermination protein NusG [Lachnospiraceae bacterium]
MAEAKWYAVHTYSGYENKVKDSIKSTALNRNLDEEILDVVIPMEKVEEEKKGVMVIVEHKMFPGYVLIHMVMNDDTWYVVRNTRGVTGFVGPGSKPVPLTQQEVDTFLANQDNVSVNVDFKVGDSVVITSGLKKGEVSVIKRIDMSKRTVTIDIEMFGRETPTEVPFSDVKKN